MSLIRWGQKVSTNYLTKTKLAAVLTSTKRTLTNYVSAGVLPAPVRFGRDVGWSVEVLRSVLEAEQGSLNALPESRRVRLRQALSDLDIQSIKVADSAADFAPLGTNDQQHKPLPEPIFVDESFNPVHDLRSSHLQKLKLSRSIMDYVATEARQAKNCSIEKKELWDQITLIRSDVEHHEAILAENFLHLHSSSQLVGSRDIFSSPIFNIRNHKSPREKRVELSFTLTDATVVKYEGPELRQDDGLVFMALLNITRDVKVGKTVGFSAQNLCDSLWGYYDGAARNRLKAMICRLQEALLQFPTFRVQLVQRFDFPNRGLWSVVLDDDIVSLITKKTVVWLDFEERLSLPSGISSWLYGYIRSQTRLIPTKIDRLRRLSGSEGAQDGFRESLKGAMGVLVGALLVDAGWHIDKHDMLHWQKKY
ncbi:plasmid replication initiator TrfA [Rhodoferax ferrireducens]|uniref:plasmid replication initiator TrfA n=1 Tax=Rhodoferax ferrireducens TaxID=192843 RepID=UPI000E0D5CF6|nr:plasmid replication initiator TrfA [Rhodoferax ferrireducens]